VTGFLPAALATAAGLAVLAGVSGLVLSFHLGIAAGASVALCAALLAGAAQLSRV
jgi:ABC-type Mn2+/Zn2+ transport system permease subunit